MKILNVFQQNNEFNFELKFGEEFRKHKSQESSVQQFLNSIDSSEDGRERLNTKDQKFVLEDQTCFDESQNLNNFNTDQDNDSQIFNGQSLILQNNIQSPKSYQETSQNYAIQTKDISQFPKIFEQQQQNSSKIYKNITLQTNINYQSIQNQNIENTTHQINKIIISAQNKSNYKLINKIDQYQRKRQVSLIKSDINHISNYSVRLQNRVERLKTPSLIKIGVKNLRSENTLEKDNVNLQRNSLFQEKIKDFNFQNSKKLLVLQQKKILHQIIYEQKFNKKYNFYLILFFFYYLILLVANSLIQNSSNGQLRLFFQNFSIINQPSYISIDILNLLDIYSQQIILQQKNFFQVSDEDKKYKLEQIYKQFQINF
ncbi:hypothetical protein IMG5_062680 [Ichthyophthirius multifiliis]|uniref:Transmembrane protein n=1 Tax=Ichthyophthirius multifiliis TaxID=5932 RepID=G0QNZ4_ICHMU|nr:hypothetical protein IMG5_062680 [Ichthyophthirius multifiliis]EGR33062.1 hypothetical protein IMG5_062680 [Ichthyophthirius multifiliis]|eukprot:XP_004037048.1 hypothetical protein IMG5_062680 [Ichthyophthirius multifiliis]